MIGYPSDDAEDLAEYKLTIDALKALFSEHFPTSNIDPGWEAYWISHTASTMPWSAWNHKDVLIQLETIDRALLCLDRIYYELPQAVADAFHFDAFRRSKEFEGNVSPADAALLLCDLHSLLSPSIRAAKVAVKKGEHERRTNWEGVTTIDACRTSWRRCTGNEAPSGSDLDLASPFGKFVQDIFETMKTKGKPRSVMQAWHRVQSNDEKT